MIAMSVLIDIAKFSSYRAFWFIFLPVMYMSPSFLTVPPSLRYIFKQLDFCQCDGGEGMLVFFLFFIYLTESEFEKLYVLVPFVIHFLCAICIHCPLSYWINFWQFLYCQDNWHSVRFIICRFFSSLFVCRLTLWGFLCKTLFVYM